MITNRSIFAKTFVNSFVLCFLLFLQILPAEAQVWAPYSSNPDNPNFFEIQKNFEDYWKNRKQERGKGYKPFKRWEWFWEQRVDAQGNFPAPDFLTQEWAAYRKAYAAKRVNEDIKANWQSLGPNTSQSGYDGIGRLNFITFHPTDKNTIFVGSPAGGLWKSTDMGANWVCLTDEIPSLGVSAIVINPKKPSQIFIATGDGNASDTYSVGVLKSEDGGKTWEQTGLNWTQNQTRSISALLMHPDNDKILIAASSFGIFKTENGGTDWVRTATFRAKDLQFKPGNPQILYTASYGTKTANIFRSTDGGNTFSQVTSFNDLYRINLAVTPDAPDMVFAVTAEAEAYGFGGFFVSENSGESFTLKYNSKNLLGYSAAGNDTGGQGFYDLTIAVSPKNKNLIMIGGVNTWRSNDGGKTFELSTAWADGNFYNPDRKAVVHADKHYHAFHPLDPDVMFQCNDGGLYYTNDGGVKWTDITNGLEITQFYKLSCSQKNHNKILGGAQDNGSRMRSSGKDWFQATGGDGMEVIIDYLDDKHCFSSYANGVLYYSPSGFTGGDTRTISDNIEGGNLEGAWVTPFKMSQIDPRILYAAYNDVYKSLNRGSAWRKISNNLSKDRKITSLGIAPSDDNVIYAATQKRLWVTFNNGGTWKEISSKLPFASANLTYISVHPENPKLVYVTFSGYSAGNKVFRSEDGGENWDNMSYGLPNLPANCVIFDKTQSEAMYVAMDIGIYYRDDVTNEWVLFNHGLPNVPVTELEIQYSAKKLRASTYGRGIWETDLYFNPNAIPEPFITSFTPLEGESGTEVTIFGRNFANTNRVTFNGTEAEFTYLSVNRVKTKVPAGARTGKISLRTPGGTAVSDDDFIINVVAGVEENEFIRQNVFVSPNPADEHITVTLKNLPKGGEIFIFDALGKQVFTQKMTQSETKIDLRNLPSGAFHVKILTEKGNAQRSIVKK